MVLFILALAVVAALWGLLVGTIQQIIVEIIYGIWSVIVWIVKLSLWIIKQPFMLLWLIIKLPYSVFKLISKSKSKHVKGVQA